ncbi:MAG: hypothetical protein JWP56_455 [Aeromicrobium sp.]|jgi:putative membrane protein|nr:hypothetical protein [Aeromicrobium sp.]
MERFLSTWLVSAVALAFAALILGDHMTVGADDATAIQQLIAVLLVALVFTIVNSFVGPIVKILSLPFIIITLGLALLIINALLLLLTEQITDAFDVAFTIDGFGWAVVASILISLAQTVVGAFVGSKR